ncbi:solute carrier family 22 member 4-like isoform X2 [Cydia pomonella]|uniref:solute carrier family 22 member 4-like isoform X2 n=1 Tax=Cydia pomonella TaxID=82600 RepID=UPI002ADDB9E6|nr:solute carrier family 22 member 4-like isoform X2 [Cydia pomonella]
MCKKKINLDRILVEEVGWGKFQIKVLVLCTLVSTMAGLQTYSYLFTLTRSRTRCLIPECEDILAPDVFSPTWILEAVPRSGDSFDNCHRFSTINMSQYSVSCSETWFDKKSLVQCQEYVYEHKNSAYFEFNLACDDFRPYLVGSARILGMMISLPIKGFVADRWGRRLALALTAFNLAWTGTLTCVAGSYTSYTMLSFIEYLLGSCSFSCAYILESIRWLVSKGRYDETLAILKKASEMNGTSISENTLKAFLETKKDILEKKEKHSLEPWLVCLVFKHKPILLRCLVTPMWWITATLMYFGLTISAVGISGNKYLNFIASVGIEIPGYWLSVLLMDRIGRRALVMTGFWISGACQIAFIFTSGYYLLSLSVYLIGKMCISCVMTSLYVYTAEMYPTRYRVSFLAYSSLMGKFGSIVAPLMPGLGAQTWEHLPFLIFGVMALVSGLLVLLAPETLGATLPDTMEQASQLGKDSTVLRGLRTLVFRSKAYSIS